MSALGDKAAVVSLGMACQTSRQIRRHIRLLRRLTGDNSLRVSSFPFDWLISPVEAVAKMLEDSAFFPDREQDLSYKAERPWWAQYNVYFWHEFTRKRRAIPIHEGFQNAREKFAYMAAKFCKLRDVKQRIFVVSNTQNNLEKVKQWTGTIDPAIDRESLRSLQSATDTFMGDGSNRFLVVSYESRIKLPVGLERTSLQLIAEDNTEWEGSDKAWSAAFEAGFSEWKQPSP